MCKMGKVTKFLVEKLPPPMAPAQQKINLKDKVEDGEIDLSMSDLQDVPVRDIASIKKAHSLDLSNNHISLLPKNFATLVHIIKLDLSKNQLTELPENFGDLIKLKHLDLYKNQLHHLPLSFGKLQALKWLDLKDNPLVPAIANIAGPCLESKQCQKCAKDIVTFYGQLQTKVEEERKLREEQRQKNLQANAQKVKQEKKSKKDKKEKVKQSKENGQAATEEENSKKAANGTSSKNHQSSSRVKVQSNVLFGFLRLLCMMTLLAAIMLFVLTAAEVKYVQGFQNKTIELWNNGVHQLPPNLQRLGVQVGENIKLIHELTGNGVVTVTSYVCELAKSKSINIIFTEVTDVFKNVTQTASEFYFKVFGK